MDTFVISGEPDVTAEHCGKLSSEFNVIGSCQPQQASEIGWPRHLRWLHPPTINRAVNMLIPQRQFELTQPKAQAALEAVVAQQKYDMVVTRYLSTAVATGVLGRHRVVVDVDDLPTAMIDSRLSSGEDSRVRSWYLRRVHRHLASIEQRQLSQCAHVWFAKEADVARAGAPRCSILRNIPFAEPGQPEAWAIDMSANVQSKILLTVGMLNYGPNVAGIDGFLRHAWPEIVRLFPAAQYRIVGSRLEPATKARWERYPGVVVVGFANDLQAEYRAAAVTICPIPWGGGTNIKVAESMAYSRPAIVSGPAHRGWEKIFPDGECILVARDSGEFVNHAVELLRDPQCRLRMGEAGRLAARESLSYDAFCKSVAAGIQDALQSSCP